MVIPFILSLFLPGLWGLECSSDVLSDRLGISEIVVLAKLIHSSKSLEISCWLKQPDDFYKRITFSSPFVENTNFCDEEQIIPIYQKDAVFFANYSSIHENHVKLVAAPFSIETQESWSLTLSSCQISMAKPDENRTPYICCPIDVHSCDSNVSIQAINLLNEQSNTTETVATTQLHTTTTPIGTCQEDCIFELCDSACLKVRIEKSDAVFWGQTSSNGSFLVYCWLKFIAQSPPKYFKVEMIGDSTNRCNQWNPSSSFDSPFVYFVSRDDALKNWKMNALPIKISSYPAWNQVTRLCDLNINNPDPNLLLPFEAQCMSQTNQCIGDLAVELVESLNNWQCTSTDSSLATRFSNINIDTDNFIVYGIIISPNKMNVSGSINRLLSQYSTIGNLSSDFDPCFNEHSLQEIGVNLLLSLSGYAENKVITRPIRANSESWLAICHLCTLWRLQSTGCILQQPVDDFNNGCFMDIEEKELDHFDGVKKKMHCKTLRPESFNERLDQGSVVFSGSIYAVNYEFRKLTVIVGCILKNDLHSAYKIAAGDSIQISVNIDDDGCFSIDKSFVGNGQEFIFFTDSSSPRLMAAKEIKLSNHRQLSLFASSCKVDAINVCNATLDLRVACYRDLNISQIIIDGNLPPDSGIVSRLICCPEMSIFFNNVTFDGYDFFFWGQIREIVPMSLEDDGGLVAIAVQPMCYLKYNTPKPPNTILTLAINIKDLVIPLYQFSEYIFSANNLANSPWSLVAYETASPPVSASTKSWQYLCSTCGIRIQFDSNAHSERCQATCQNPSYICRVEPDSSQMAPQVSEVNLISISCPTNSTLFSERIDNGNEKVVVLWGVFISSTKFPMNVKYSINTSTEVLKPLETSTNYHMEQEMLEIKFKPLCQISGNSKVQPESSKDGIYFIVRWNCFDCFYNKNFKLTINTAYLFAFTDSNHRLISQPIVADDKSIDKLSSTCSISPPSDPRFEYDDPRTEVCQKLKKQTTQCMELSVSDIEPKHDETEVTDNSWVWILIGTCAGLLLIIVAVLSIVLIRSKKFSSSRSLRATADFSDVPMTNVVMSKIKEAVKASTTSSDYQHQQLVSNLEDLFDD